MDEWDNQGTGQSHSITDNALAPGSVIFTYLSAPFALAGEPIVANSEIFRPYVTVAYSGHYKFSYGSADHIMKDAHK